ncbi:MAG: cryptochrome/photolyase family protein [Pseudanabaena sp.]
MPKNTFIPVIPEIEPDAITQEVMELVQKSLPNSFGKLDRFTYAVTRDRALELAKLFIETRLANFGA